MYIELTCEWHAKVAQLISGSSSIRSASVLQRINATRLVHQCIKTLATKSTILLTFEPTISMRSKDS